MSCKDPLNDCGPCKDCDDPAPVLPRCNNALPDGTYTNATVVVQGGCITAVQTGAAPLYTPELCCDGSSGGDCDCEDGQDGQDGQDGEAATVEVGTYSMVPEGSPLTITNSGTTSHAVLNFQIPMSACNCDDGGGGTTGVTDNTAGIEIEDGVVKSLPLTWPPALTVSTTVTNLALPTPLLLFSASSVDSNGEVVLTIDESALMNWINLQITNALAPLQSDITDLQTDVSDIQANCCP